MTEFNTLPLSDPKTKNRSPEALVWLVDNVRCGIIRIFYELLSLSEFNDLDQNGNKGVRIPLIKS